MGFVGITMESINLENTYIHFFGYNNKPPKWGYFLDMTPFHRNIPYTVDFMTDSPFRSDNVYFPYDNKNSMLSYLLSMKGNFLLNKNGLSLTGNLLLGVGMDYNYLNSVQTPKNLIIKIPLKYIDWEFIPIFGNFLGKKKYGQWGYGHRIDGHTIGGNLIKNFYHIWKTPGIDKIALRSNTPYYIPSLPFDKVRIPAYHFHIFIGRWNINLGFVFTILDKKNRERIVKTPKSFKIFLKLLRKERVAKSKNLIKDMKKNKTLMKNCYYCNNKIKIKNKDSYFCEACGWTRLIENNDELGKEIEIDLLKKFLFVQNFKIFRRRLQENVANALFQVFQKSQKDKGFFTKKYLKTPPLAIAFLPTIQYISKNIPEIFKTIENRINNSIPDSKMQNIIDNLTNEIYENYIATSGVKEFQI